MSEIIRILNEFMHTLLTIAIFVMVALDFFKKRENR